jgi:hypothetical protein
MGCEPYTGIEERRRRVQCVLSAESRRNVRDEIPFVIVTECVRLNPRQKSFLKPGGGGFSPSSNGLVRSTFSIRVHAKLCRTNRAVRSAR